MKNKKDIFLFIGVLFVAVAIYFGQYHLYNGRITAWAAAHDKEVVNIERRLLSTGPYWPDKNFCIYRVTCSDSNIYWVKFYLGMTVKQQLTNGEYLKITE